MVNVLLRSCEYYEFQFFFALALLGHDTMNPSHVKFSGSRQRVEVRLDVELLPCESPTAPVLGSKASGEPVAWAFQCPKGGLGCTETLQGL